MATKRMYFARRLCRNLWVLGLVLGAARGAHSHNPHNEIDALGLSPAYSDDQIVFIAQTGAENVRPEGPLVSRNDGLTWSGIPRGMDNRSDFTSVSVSPRFPEDGVVDAFDVIRF